MIFDTRPACVVIPTLNNEKAIFDLVERFTRDDITVIVVDDNSKDFTGLYARRAGAWVVVNKSQLGYAKALLKGLKTATDLDCFDYIATIDPAGYTPGQLFSMLELMPTSDLVIGSRFLPFSKYKGSYIKDWSYAKLCNLLKRTKYTDWTSSFRIYRENLVKELLKYSFTSSSNTLQIEILAKANSLGSTITEYPVEHVSRETLWNIKETYRALKAIYSYPKRDTVSTKESINGW